THALALGISLLAYVFARKHSQDTKFAIGTWKIEMLGAYTSAILLGIMGLLVAGFSIERLYFPLSINYDIALVIATLGLIINIVCAVILGHEGNHTHSEHGHDHGGNNVDEDHDIHHSHNGQKDLNLQSAYVHVIADALTSVFAIVALLGAKYYGLNWLDPAMGILGSILIFRWTYFLLRDTSTILIDRTADDAIMQEIKTEIEGDGKSEIKDLHIWKVGQDKFACMLCIDAKSLYTTHDYQHRLVVVHELAHTTIEVENHK
ncbi:CDF family Co(II)/Ni(II) efflux transporter DmeF, partial [Candidatus Gracilibacteria bacterium]|nr:CDF family Co(II)/Ni(II) efflux transporter DmeF [Candidatus Gracilibacteria bacterium]